MLVKYTYFHEFYKLILAFAFTRGVAGSSTRSEESGGAGGHLPQMPHPGSAIGLIIGQCPQDSSVGVLYRFLAAMSAPTDIVEISISATDTICISISVHLY